MHDKELYLYYYWTIGVCNIQHVILARNTYASACGCLRFIGETSYHECVNCCQVMCVSL